ncbi:MAG: YARHG domain-containing protein [Burkholderiales bacterium]
MLLLTDIKKNPSLWCDAYIGDDHNSVIASQVTASCPVGSRCVIDGLFAGHGVFYWTKIMSATRVQREPSCDALWQQRNSIYRSGGFCFKTPKAVATFGNTGCKFDDIQDVPLSDRDRRSIDEISKLEALSHCDAVLANGETFGPIALRIELTPGARKKLVENDETITVAAYYFGNSKRSEGGNPPGDIDLGQDRFEVGPDAPATVPARTFDRRLLDRVYNRTPIVNVNVFSSRKIFKDNILDCSGPQDPVVELAKHPQTVTCKLIGERD